MLQREIEKSGFPEVIRESRREVVLQGFDPTHAEELWHYILTDRTSETRRSSWSGLGSLMEVSEYLASCDVSNPSSSEFGYFIRDFDGKLVGTFHIHTISWWNQKVEVGYGVHHLYEGEGWASKALQVVEGILEEKGFRRIEIRCDPMNVRSVALAERNDYVLEGTLRQAVRVGDRFRDEAVYAKIFGPIR